jgi:hypothetical protein
MTALAIRQPTLAFWARRKTSMGIHVKDIYVDLFKARYGYWVGPAYGGGVQSPAGQVYTPEQRAVRGVDPFDDLVARPHDIAYDDAQQDLLAQLDAGADRVAAFRAFVDAIRVADEQCVCDAIVHRAETMIGEMMRASTIPVMRCKSRQSQQLLDVIDAGDEVLLAAIHGADLATDAGRQALIALTDLKMELEILPRAIGAGARALVRNSLLALFNGVVDTFRALSPPRLNADADDTAEDFELQFNVTA